MIPFHENVLPGATQPESGSYAAFITNIEEDGAYLVTMRADDNNGMASAATPFGEDADRPGKRRSVPRERIGPFQIEAVTTFEAFGYAGNLSVPPLKITTLYASVDSDQCVRLSWGAPLNISDQAAYEVRYASQPMRSESAWNSAQPGCKGKYWKKGGGSIECTLCGVGKGRHFFAVRSFEGGSSQSEISNNYIVVIR
jgi:hypothetical protein